MPLLIGSNPNLDPETSKAFTAGFVYQPSWADGLHLLLDHYTFEIMDAIATLTG